MRMILNMARMWESSGCGEGFGNNDNVGFGDYGERYIDNKNNYGSGFYGYGSFNGWGNGHSFGIGSGYSGEISGEESLFSR